jgi:hypothetical protein
MAVGANLFRQHHPLQELPLRYGGDSNAKALLRIRYVP